MTKPEVKTINNFVQALPNGPEQADTGKLLAWVAKSVSEMKDVQVTDMVLKNANVAGEKPQLAVYYDTSDKSSESEYKPQVLVVMLDKGKDQGNIVMLLEMLQKQLASIMPKEVFDITLENEINELGDRYKLTVYYDA